ncbi:hypothetical protein AOLI_G00267810 [Acnodon oligacanthus]
MITPLTKTDLSRSRHLVQRSGLPQDRRLFLQPHTVRADYHSIKRAEISPSSGGGQQRQISQAQCDSKTWKISLDVSHFCAEEIVVKTNEGYLEITGKHEERQDEHGIISRSFTRKYKLPAEVDLHQMSSTLSPEGILSVEAPLGASSITSSTETVIPIQMQQKQ